MATAREKKTISLIAETIRRMQNYSDKDIQQIHVSVAQKEVINQIKQKCKEIDYEPPAWLYFVGDKAFISNVEII